MSAIPRRQWQASLMLGFASRGEKTALVQNAHKGPLRVLKPFYPEGDVCHTYLLHPPGGLVLGDELNIDISVAAGAHALITTPSAGKVYSTDNASEPQFQKVALEVKGDGCLEWLPQETLIFDGANARLLLDAKIDIDSKLAVWDVVCFGRPASQLAFLTGSALQHIRIEQAGKPLLIERNWIEAGSKLQRSLWGMAGCDTLGTFIITLEAPRQTRQQWQDQLNDAFGVGHQFAITQKGGLMIARYLGPSASVCRQGFESLWQIIRPIFNNRPACAPRIWAT